MANIIQYMANYSILKSAIAQVIKTNGNNEITGNLLQQQLFSMINTLGAGYQCMGVAVLTPTPTNPGTPDANVFYIASEPGTYANFGNIVVNDGEVCLLTYNGTWSKRVTGAATASQLNQLGQKFKRSNYFKLDVINSIVKELHITGTKDENLKYFVRSFSNVYSGQPNYFYFTIQSYDPNTQAREVILDFNLTPANNKSGHYRVVNGAYTIDMVLSFESARDTRSYFVLADYAEQYELNDNCWGEAINAPISYLINKFGGEISSIETFLYNNTPSTNTLSFSLVPGYWDGNNYIVSSPGFYAIPELIPVLPGTNVILPSFIDNYTQPTQAVGWLYNKDKQAIGTRINLGDLTDIGGGSYQYTIQNAAAAYIGLETRVEGEKLVQLQYPISLSDILGALIDERVGALNVDSKKVDIMMFMGQSNMAGRGVTNAQHPESAPASLSGYEFRPISDPTKLYPITEPFGVDENNPDGIDDTGKKTGSMVSAFVNAYYSTTGKIIVGVSASEGGTRIEQWQPNTDRLNDAIQRLTDCVTFLQNNGYTIEKKYMVWCQGESDGDVATTKAAYKTGFLAMFNAMVSAGITDCMLVRIGQYNGSYAVDYTNIIEAQTELCQENEHIIMASTALASFKDKGLMKDEFHYYQDAYNIVGTYAGRNTGLYRLYRAAKPQYDVMTGELYVSDKCY